MPIKIPRQVVIAEIVPVICVPYGKPHISANAQYNVEMAGKQMIVNHLRNSYTFPLNFIFFTSYKRKREPFTDSLSLKGVIMEINYSLYKRR